MRAILCGRGKGGGCRVVEFTEQQLEAAHAEHYPEQYQGKLEMTDKPAAPAEAPPEPPADYWPPARSARSPNLVKIPRDTPFELCKDVKCAKRIWMVKHPTTGKPTPAACEPELTLADGTVVGTGAFPPYLKVETEHGKDQSLAMDGLGYSHFIDCPSRREFRRK